MEIESILAAHHGVVRWSALRGAGMTFPELKAAVASGRLRLLRHGWYAAETADPVVVEAVTTGGVCSCVSALRLHGVWIPEGFHKVHKRARQSVHRAGVKGLCTRHGRPLPEHGSVDDVPTALAHAVRCLDAESIVVVMDSILNLGLMSRDEIEYLLRRTPKRTQALLDRCDTAEAGTETMARLRLKRRGITVATQVEIPGIGRVDLLAGKCLIIEVDGERYHASSEQFHRDRERDVEAHRLGYLTMRLAYRQVVHTWATSEAAILAVVRRGDHLR
ncbi:endonuclease domain-containing protein, partial [Gordonia sp. (in: high G+C Gram-positive bacteria)]|uniref:endonuclease domain-containing protein n=1 Tax=Gordonia sp. (in: high G+C Gram-positive bacteria) TaxID=84139 RepID=UPI002617BDB3